MAFKKSTIPSFVRVALALQNNCTIGGDAVAYCYYCGDEGSMRWWSGSWVHFSGLEMDHVYPEVLGGANDIENIVLACRYCNRSKGHRTVEQWKVSLRATANKRVAAR